jgi:hypothetical protein
MREESAWAAASIEHSALQEVYRWLWPDRYAEMVAGDDMQGNARGRTNHIFDHTAMEALHDGAGQVAEAIHPWDQPWARWIARAGVSPERREQLTEAANVLTELGLSTLARSNFHTEATASHKDFLVGNGHLLMELDARDERRIVCSSLPSYRMAPECDAAGRWTGFFRRYRPRARDLDSMFPEKITWSPETQKAQREKPETRIDLCYGWTYDHKTGGWRSYGWEREAKHLFRESFHRSSPIIGYRSVRTGGRAWACGPASAIVPTVKVANRLVEFILRNAAVATIGMWQADDDGVLNPGTIKLAPGCIIPKARGSDGLTPLEAPGRFDVSQLVLDDLRVMIRKSLYVTRIAEREMTAQEYQGRLQQQLRDMRGMYGQMRTEFVVPVQMRVLDLNVEMGQLTEEQFSDLLDVEMTGPLAQDARAAEVQRVAEAKMMIDGMVGPELGMASLNAHEMVPWVVQQLHIKSELFKSSAELKEFGDQVMQLAAQAIAAQMAGQGEEAPDGGQ